MGVVTGGGGATFPATWTIDPTTGSVFIAAPPSSFEGENGFGGLILQSTDDNNTFDVFLVRNANGDAQMGIDPFGYIVSGGLEASSPLDTHLIKVDGGAPGTMSSDYLRISGGGSFLLRVTGAGNVVMPGLPTSDPAVAGALYSVTGVVHVSAG